MSRYGLILNTDGTGELFEVQKGTNDSDPNYATLKLAVGGYIEPIRLAEDLLLYCNEEGKMYNLPYNEVATALVKSMYESNGYTWGDYLVGNVVFVGDDGTPNSAGVPDRWVTEFQMIGVWPEGIA